MAASVSAQYKLGLEVAEVLGLGLDKADDKAMTHRIGSRCVNARLDCSGGSSQYKHRLHWTQGADNRLELSGYKHIADSGPER